MPVEWDVSSLRCGGSMRSLTMTRLSPQLMHVQKHSASQIRTTKFSSQLLSVHILKVSIISLLSSPWLSLVSRWKYCKTLTVQLQTRLWLWFSEASRPHAAPQGASSFFFGLRSGWQVVVAVYLICCSVPRFVLLPLPEDPRGAAFFSRLWQRSTSAPMSQTMHSHISVQMVCFRDLPPHAGAVVPLPLHPPHLPRNGQ